MTSRLKKMLMPLDCSSSWALTPVWTGRMGLTVGGVEVVGLAADVTLCNVSFPRVSVPFILQMTNNTKDKHSFKLHSKESIRFTIRVCPSNDSNHDSLLFNLVQNVFTGFDSRFVEKMCELNGFGLKSILIESILQIAVLIHCRFTIHSFSVQLPLLYFYFICQSWLNWILTVFILIHNFQVDSRFKGY